MDTTCGSFALQGAKAKKNAVVVDLLMKADMIIIAKTNLTVSFRLCSKQRTNIDTQLDRSLEEWRALWWPVVGLRWVDRYVNRGRIRRCVADDSVQTRSPYVRGEVASTPFLGHSVSNTRRLKQTLYTDSCTFADTLWIILRECCRSGCGLRSVVNRHGNRWFAGAASNPSRAVWNEGYTGISRHCRHSANISSIWQCRRTRKKPHRSCQPHGYPTEAYGLHFISGRLLDRSTGRLCRSKPVAASRFCGRAQWRVSGANCTQGFAPGASLC